jgi:hypothetical protein
MKIILSLIVMIMLILTASCGVVKVQPAANLALENDEIDAALRQEIHSINDKVISIIQQNDLEAFSAYFVSGAGDDTLKQQIKDVFPRMVNITQGKKFEEYADYYCKWQGEGNIPFTILPKDSTDFRISIERANNEMFIILMNTSSEFNQFLLSTVYTKQDNAWKIYKSHISLFKVAEKNAVQWYEDALAGYDKGYLVPALFRLQMANSCLQPAPFMKYDTEGKMADFVKQVQTETKAKYSFPIQLTSVKSQPVIYYIEPQFVQKKILPVIKYVTSYSKADTNKIESEAREMIPEIQKLFPGIAEGASHLVFKAFSEPPLDPAKVYESYGTLVEVN